MFYFHVTYNRNTVEELHRLEKYLEETFYLSERIEAFKKKKLYTMEIEVTRACDLECTYCYSSSSRLSKLQMTPQQILKILNEASDYGIKEIYWLGGETLQYPYIVEMLYAAKDLGFRNVISTNGSRLSGEMIDHLLKMVDWISFHLDTIDAETFGQLHNMDKDEAEFELQSTFDGIDRLLEAGFPSKRIRLAVVLTKNSYTTLRETLAWGILTKGFHTSTLIPLAAIGYGKNDYSQSIFPPEALAEAFKIRSEIEKRPELLRLGPSEFCKHYELTNCYIDVFGFVHPYVGIDLRSNNLKNKTLSNIIDENYQSLSFSDLVNETGEQNLISGKCGSCENSKYCFGTRTYSCLINNIYDSNPLCWLVQNNVGRRKETIYAPY
jgi:MoaA/NifB/PqqE/SkfB family radical SAM enzyme